MILDKFSLKDKVAVVTGASTGLGVQMANDQLGVHHFESGQVLVEVTSLELGGVLHGDADFLVLKFFDHLPEADLLQVEDDIRNIFLHTRYGCEFVFYAFNAHGIDGITLQGRKQNTAKRITYGNTEAGLQRTKFELAVFVVGLHH